MKNGEQSSLRAINMRAKTLKHSVARLAAVQALYQIELNDTLVSNVIEEFRCYRFETEVIDSIEVARGIDVIELKSQICNVQKYFNKIDNTKDITSSYIIILKVIHE